MTHVAVCSASCVLCREALLLCRAIAEQKLESFGLLYYNALTALPASIMIAVVLGEFERLAEFEYRLAPVRRWAAAVAGPPPPHRPSSPKLVPRAVCLCVRVHCKD